jgi:PST family polysaccharide transporter
MAVQLISFAFGIALARLLSPREFGLMAMLTVLTQFVAQIPNLGLEEALIQKRDLDESHRSSVFWALLVVGLLLAAGFVLCAPWIAAFYETRELTPLAALLSVALVLRTVGSVPRALMLRQLNLRPSVMLQCAAAVGGGSCAVALAWAGWGAASLAFQLIVTSGLESLLLFVASTWRPRLEFRAAALRDLLGFTTHRFATRGLNYWAQNIDQLLIGKFLGSDPVGLYVRAYNLVRFPVVQVSRATIRVMFPSLALIQDEPARVRDVYVRATGAVALATFPMCMGLFAVAEPFVVGVLGPQWRDTVPLVRVLSLAAVMQSITTLAGSLYLAQGRADLQLRVTALQRVLTIGAIAVGLQFGVLGVAVARVGAAALNVVPTFYFAGRLVNLRVTALLARAGPVFGAGAVMTAIVVGVDSWAAAHLAELARLGLDVLTGVLVYWLALRLLRVRAYVDVVDLLRRPGANPARP